MTRKDYELIAAAIKRVKDAAHNYETAHPATTLESLAEALSVDMLAANPAFKPARFMKAAGF